MRVGVGVVGFVCVRALSRNISFYIEMVCRLIQEKGKKDIGTE